jgi:hypothetical protein
MLGHLHFVVGSVRPGGVTVIAPPAGVPVVVPVVGVAVARVMCVGLRSSQTERAHRKQPGQKHRDYHAGAFMKSESPSHSVLVSQKTAEGVGSDATYRTSRADRLYST